MAGQPYDRPGDDPQAALFGYQCCRSIQLADTANSYPCNRQHTHPPRSLIR
jgi:hypothetical protein